LFVFCFFFFQAEDGIRDRNVTGVQTCALPIWQFPGGKFIITEAVSALNSRGVYEPPSDSVASYETPYVKDHGPQPNRDYRLSSRSEERRVGKECRSRRSTNK